MMAVFSLHVLLSLDLNNANKDLFICLFLYTLSIIF